ncbi:MAG: hypothetical protein ACLGGX_08650 [Bdellovibrionia bacterium]
MISAVTKSFTLLFLSGFIVGCALFDKPIANENVSPLSFKQRIFFASYDEVWRAAHTVLKYPIAVDNQDTGVIETEYIKGVDGWLPPEVAKPPSSGFRYKISMVFARGKVGGRESVRVTIEKKNEILRNFFSEPEQQESDGLEEKVLFYRMEREIIINEALRKAGLN